MGNSIKQLSNIETAAFCEQMGMILNAGISPLEGISVMKEDAATNEAKAILSTIEKTYTEGATFHQSLVSANVFPAYALNLIRIGEDSGNLEEVMNSLSYHYEREESIKSGIKNAVTYPFIIIGMMAVVILVLIINVMPVFNDVFAQLGSSLDGVSAGLLKAGTYISNYSFVFIGILVVALLFYLFLAKTAPGHKIFNYLFARFFITKSLSEQISTARFASGMALTVSAGLDLEEGLDLASQLSDNPYLSKKIDECRALCKEGMPLTDSFIKCNLFGSMYSHMVTIGEKTGCTDKVLQKIADSIDKDTETRISNLISILEPTLVIVLSVIICLILLSVMLPLMGILSGML